jgi:hypothetical protein
MQMDGHHTMTYVAARIAGFEHPEAEIIAYSAQYIDDATNSGPIQFSNSLFMYERSAPAHKMIDYTNFIEVSNHLAWLPFHFLPGNGGSPQNTSTGLSDAERLICRPDSAIARDMMATTLIDKNTSRALHRLGVAIHVYADTFAHQGFMGGRNEINQVSELSSPNTGELEKIKERSHWEVFRTAFKRSTHLFPIILRVLAIMIQERRNPLAFIREFLSTKPLGHAAADVYPDLPYLQWQYKNGRSEIIVRNNPEIYLQSAVMMVKVFRAWRADDRAMALENYEGPKEQDLKIIDTLLRNTKTPDAHARHARWLDAIAEGQFSFGPATIHYKSKGKGSWKYRALGSEKKKDTGLEIYTYTPGFLTSDWKLFHDAVVAHRYAVVHDVLPRFGICAA